VLGWLAEANVAPRPAATPILTACVTIRRNGLSRSPRTQALSTPLNGPAAARLVPRDCPHTYASMIARYDSLGRFVSDAPKGWVDPTSLVITEVEGWSRDVVRISPLSVTR